jgi:hypothetical protein
MATAALAPGWEAMTLYAIWQPLDNEDQRTALVFGFLRHAPPEHGLSPWLTDILGRRVTAKALEPEDFWPGYTSHMPHRTGVPPVSWTLDRWAVWPGSKDRCPCRQPRRIRLSSAARRSVC